MGVRALEPVVACRRGPSVIGRPTWQGKPAAYEGRCRPGGSGLTADVLFWGPNPRGGDRMASRPEMIGNLALSVTRFWEFMAGAGIEPTAIPKEGNPLSGIHGRKTPLRHPPPNYPIFTLFMRNVRTDRDVSPSQGFGACTSMADKISERSWRQYRLSALLSPFPVRDYSTMMSSRALRTRTTVSSRSLL